MILPKVAALQSKPPEVTVDGTTVAAPVTDPALLAAVVRRLDDAGVVVAELALRGSSLDEVFLSLTGRRADDVDATGITDKHLGSQA